MANHSRRNFLKKLGLLGSASLLPLTSSGELPRRRQGEVPNIVFLLSDDQSRPDLGCYGNPAVHTPNLDRLAGEGMRFNRAYVTSSSCSPSRGSMLTGRSPHATGSSRLHVWVLPEMANLLGMLKPLGYHFGAYRKLHQDNYKDQFDFYGDESTPLDTFFKERPRDRPFFLWFGSNDPHRPYASGAFDPPHNPADVTVPDFLPDTPEVRQDIAHYYDQLARFDAECGQILKHLKEFGLVDNTLVVMTSDNGMAFPRAKATLYEAGLNVPLLMRWPGKIKEGEVTDELVSLMDLTATWLDMAGVSRPDDMEGQSLLPLLTGGDYESREYIFAGRNWHDNWAPGRAVIGKRYKLIQNYRPAVGYLASLDILDSPSYKSIQKLLGQQELKEPLAWYANTSRPQQELYDLEEDPGEWNNRIDDSTYSDQLAELETALSDWMDSTNDFLPPPRNAYGAWNDDYRNVDPLDGRLNRE